MIRGKLQENPEQQLISALKHGDQSALGQLYTTHAPVLLGVITKIVQHAAIAEEVLQETFVAIWSRISLYDPSKNRFLTWGLAIARGIAIEALNTGKYGHLVQPIESTTFVLNQQNEKLQEAFCQLEPQEKAALELIYLKGYSCQQAANALGIAQEALTSCLKMAFKHIGAQKAA
jgi:RNA polymerase sigma factor (sigma-70 family)